MSQDDGDGCSGAEAIREDTNDIVDETKNLMIEARSSLTTLICSILLMSLISIFLSTWLAKTITNSQASFGSIVSHYFGFDRNGTEPNVTWWTPKHVKTNDLISRNKTMNNNHATSKLTVLKIPYSDYPNFHTIVLPLLFICSILLAVLAYYARVKCTNRDFAWGAVPKIPLERVDPSVVVATLAKEKEAEPGIDYTIVQGTDAEPVVFALAETVEPLREEGDIIDEGTQYEPEDVLKVITHVSSAPQLHTNIQIIPSSSSPSSTTPSDEQKHIMDVLKRQPLPTLSPSK
ncbi:unnamed protein product [Adineta steineri]|uniref:Uncharacterized protein n=1 Tax=Adineta steineri TaxID=433720 RepID=A0A818H3I9_9BILA|nr:unnamed protein product [Adineta steineri]CAF3501709.1 unnamed protein product [Adineta steineri]